MQRPDVPGYPPISAYAAIGDCHTLALVSLAGSIDWYCPGRFDAPAVFCRILDAREGGFLRLAPTGGFDATRRYLGATNVLETTFQTGSGRVRVVDCMPIHSRTADRSRRGYDVGTSDRVLRLVEGLAGEVELELCFKPTFDYARVRAQLRPLPDLGAVAEAEGHYLALACRGVQLEPFGDAALCGRLRLRAGERRWVTLTYAQSPDRAREALAPAEGDEPLRRTLDYWERWSAACTYRGPYRDQVLRSALALKLLDYEPTGSMVAAPTTSLPEEIGGVRNWDYRYTWLRDSALILYALVTVGYDEEATDFFEWLGRACGGEAGCVPQIMYGVDGRRDLPEITLDHLEGYRGSRPVRVGNAAYTQDQLDIFGEVLRAAFIHYQPVGGARRAGPESMDEGDRPSPRAWGMLRSLVEQAERRWPEPDRGIWEVRGMPQHFLHSKLMCWAALDRGIRLAEAFGLEAPLARWRSTRGAVRQAILERGFDLERGAFTQAFGSTALDASALEIPLVGFLPPTDPRVRSTVERIRAELLDNGLVYRYRAHDGLPGGEATFALCSFWLVDALALGGRLDEAHALFEQVAGYANDVGLLAEEIDPRTGELLGNFPQGFSHLALVSSAVNLAKAARHGAEETAENEGRRAERAGEAAAAGAAPGGV